MRRTLGTLLGAALAVTVTAPAQARQVTVEDRVGDVLQGRVDMDGGYVVQSGIREGDVIRTVFRHGPHNVVVTSTFRKLDQVGSYHAYYLRLQTGRRTYREVDVEAGPGHWGGLVTVTRQNGDKVRCDVSRRIDYVANTVRVTVPRTCLDRPTYVRGTAANVWSRPDVEDPAQSDYVMLDNPHTTSHLANTWTRWIRKG